MKILLRLQHFPFIFPQIPEKVTEEEMKEREKQERGIYNIGNYRQ